MTSVQGHSTVLWLDCAHEPHDCEADGCLARIGVGEPLAWERGGDEGKLLCLDCGSAAEDVAEMRRGPAWNCSGVTEGAKDG